MCQDHLQRENYTLSNMTFPRKNGSNSGPKKCSTSILLLVCSAASRRATATLKIFYYYYFFFCNKKRSEEAQIDTGCISDWKIERRKKLGVMRAEWVNVLVQRFARTLLLRFPTESLCQSLLGLSPWDAFDRVEEWEAPQSRCHDSRPGVSQHNFPCSRDVEYCWRQIQKDVFFLHEYFIFLISDHFTYFLSTQPSFYLHIYILYVYHLR